MGLGPRFGGKQGFQVGVGADTVVLAIGRYEGTIKADITAFHGRYQFEFSRREIFFRYAIGLFEEIQDGVLDFLLFSSMGADDGLKLFPSHAFGHGLFHLVLGHVDQQVRNVKDGIIFVHADIDLDLLAFLRIDDAAQGQGNAGPLILLDAAVVMGTEVDKAILLMDGVTFKVKARCVNMGAHNLQPFLDGFFADHGKDD